MSDTCARCLGVLARPHVCTTVELPAYRMLTFPLDRTDPDVGIGSTIARALRESA